ncbi:MAG: N-acetyltransferase [Bacteroidales bacterium]|nr:N-acetyltransferase [Bacteroidales bacterium]
MISTKITTNTILATEDGEVVGKIEFEEKDNELIILHTYAYLSGKGIGSLLMDAAVAYAKEQNLSIKPVCPFAAKYLERKTD